MAFLNFIKTGYAKSLFVLCIAQQLSACGGGDDSPPPVRFGDASLTWQRPLLREDNVVNLPVGEIGGYRVYYGSATGDYQKEVDVANADINYEDYGTVIVDGLPVGKTYYFVVTAYDTEGRESLYSTEVAIPL